MVHIHIYAQYLKQVKINNATNLTFFVLATYCLNYVAKLLVVTQHNYVAI